ncbi:MAG: hypothetical protein JF610_03850, partial [Acidobacteria bacterium]|nr:hypothetical protein [Acidobacteriota bacterium]
AAALAAQATTATPQQQTSTKTPEKVTISGCVERADQMTSAGASTLGTTVDSLSFVLVDVPSGTTGTSGVKGNTSSATDKGYRLDADVAKLNPHVGHKVEISGYVDEPAATNGAANSVNGPKVKVETIKMIAETCGR